MEKKLKPFVLFRGGLLASRFNLTYMLTFMLTLVSISLSAISLSACGFQPLYATNSRADIVATLSQISIEAPDTRETQFVTNALYLSLSSSQKPVYRLKLSSSSSIADLAIERDSRVTRANYRQTVKYELMEIKTNQTIITGSSSHAASYNKVASEFANDQAKLNASQRTAKAIAQDIKLQIAVKLKKNERLHRRQE